MQRRHLVVLGAAAAVVVVLVAAFAWDSSRSDTIAKGVTVDGDRIGGMSGEQARAKLTKDLARTSKRPLKVTSGGQVYRLSPQRAKLAIDVAGTVDQAQKSSRAGGIFVRTWRAVTGGSVDKDIPVEFSYSRSAVRRWVTEVADKLDRAPQDATLSFSGSSLGRVPGKPGVMVNRRALLASVNGKLGDLRGARTVRPRVKTVKPAVTTAQLAQKYPTVLTVDRSGFKVHLFKRLQLTKTYTIAVGRAGFESPAGLYYIEDKQVDPVWNVPDKPWAGKLAGKTIPPGPDNPLVARWMGVADGVGFHGTNDIGSLGSAASHGCFRMAPADVIALYPEVPVGTPVYIG